MSNQTNDGGSAFPRAWVDSNGMTLRDWFAGQALAGLCCNEILIDGYGSASSVQIQINNVSHIANQIADAMIETRGAKP